MKESLSADVCYPACTVVLIEDRLNFRHLILMSRDVGSGTIQSLFLATPKANDNCSLWIGINFFKDSGYFHHRYGSRTVVGGAGATVPGIQARRKYNIFIRFFGTFYLGYGVKGGRHTPASGMCPNFDCGGRSVLNHSEELTVVLQGNIYHRNLFCTCREDFINSKPTGPVGRNNTCGSGILQFFVHGSGSFTRGFY